MKTFPIFKTAVIFLGLIGLAGLTFAQQGAQKNNKQRMEKMREMHQQRNLMQRIPDLSDQQQEQIRDIRLNTRKEVMPLQNRMREKAARLKTLRTAENADMAAINTVVEEMSSLRAEIMKARLASEQEIRSLLTDDQRMAFDSRRAMQGMLRHGKKARKQRGN